jgi:hypothetical protein
LGGGNAVMPGKMRGATVVAQVSAAPKKRSIQAMVAPPPAAQSSIAHGSAASAAVTARRTGPARVTSSSSGSHTPLSQSDAAAHGAPALAPPSQRASVSGKRKARLRTPSRSTTARPACVPARQNAEDPAPSSPRQLSNSGSTAEQSAAAVSTTAVRAPEGGSKTTVSNWSDAFGPSPALSSQSRTATSTRSPGAAKGRSTLPWAPWKAVRTPGIRLQAARASCAPQR